MAKKGCTFFPDKLLGFDFSKACKWHDHHYRLQRKRYTREEVDKRFYLGLQFEIYHKCGDDKTLIRYRLGRFIAKMMYFAVRKFAKPSWKRWQYRWYLGFIPIKRKEFIR